MISVISHRTLNASHNVKPTAEIKRLGFCWKKIQFKFKQIPYCPRGAVIPQQMLAATMVCGADLVV